MVFNKQRADDRKEWLGEYNRDSYLDTSKDSVTYTVNLFRKNLFISQSMI